VEVISSRFPSGGADRVYPFADFFNDSVLIRCPTAMLAEEHTHWLAVHESHNGMFCSVTPSVIVAVSTFIAEYSTHPSPQHDSQTSTQQPCFQD